MEIHTNTLQCLSRVSTSYTLRFLKYSPDKILIVRVTMVRLKGQINVSGTVGTQVFHLFDHSPRITQLCDKTEKALISDISNTIAFNKFWPKIIHRDRNGEIRILLDNRDGSKMCRSDYHLFKNTLIL